MELRFLAPSLQGLDEVESEVLAATLWCDERPSHGVAGLCDWRMAGRISELQRQGFITGELGEAVMLPAKPRMTFDKLLLFGAGARATFDEETFGQVVSKVLATMEGLCARVCVIELPGRHDDLIPAERAADILLAAAGRKREHDVWTLVENAAAKERITQHMIEERRRVRRIL
jgi:hypothetical protein